MCLFSVSSSVSLCPSVVQAVASGLRRAALADYSDRAVRATCYRYLDAQPRGLDVDLEAMDLVAQRGDVLIERPYLLTRSGSLKRGRSACSAALPLTRQVLFAYPLNDLTTLVHPVEKLRLQIGQPTAQMRELVDGDELPRSVRQEIRFVDC